MTTHPPQQLSDLHTLLGTLYPPGGSASAADTPQLAPFCQTLGLATLIFLRAPGKLQGAEPATDPDAGHIACAYRDRTEGWLVARPQTGAPLEAEARCALVLAGERIALEISHRALEQSVAESALEAQAIEIISREMTWGSNIDTLLDVVLRQAVHISRAAGGALYLHTEQGAELSLQTGWPPGQNWGPARIPVGCGIVGWVAEHARALHTLDQGGSPGAGAEGHTNQLAVPLISQGTVIGVLSLESAGHTPFTPTHERVLAVFAAQAAKAIAAARLIRDLRKERDLRENILAGTPNGVITVDDQRRVVLMNKAARHLFATGEPPDGPPGSPIERYLPQAPFLERLHRVLEGDTETETLELAQGSGADRQQYSINLFRLRWGDEWGASLVIKDVTQQRKLDEHVLRMGRVASLGQLAAGIAHEIRNPLTGIGITLDILREEPGLSAAGLEMIGDISREIDRLEALIHGLLDFARPRQSEHRPMRLAKTLEWHRTFREQCRNKGVEFTLEMAANPKVTGDPERLKQLFLNLAINALDATEAGGSICLTAGVHDGPDGAEHARVVVSDTGRGMDTETLEQMFDPFFTTKSDGTGLGLSIVHSIVEQHGGHLEVTSTPGVGTTCRVKLPICG